jgi:hypothetical protein
MQETFGQNSGEPLPPLTDAQRAHAQQVCTEWGIAVTDDLLEAFPLVPPGTPQSGRPAPSLMVYTPACCASRWARCSARTFSTSCLLVPARRAISRAERPAHPGSRSNCRTRSDFGLGIGRGPPRRLGRGAGPRVAALSISARIQAGSKASRSSGPGVRRGVVHHLTPLPRLSATVQGANAFPVPGSD